VFPARPAAALETCWRPGAGAQPAVKLAAAVLHGRRSTGCVCCLFSARTSALSIDRPAGFHSAASRASRPGRSAVSRRIPWTSSAVRTSSTPSPRYHGGADDRLAPGCNGDVLDDHALLAALPFNLAIVSTCSLKTRMSRAARFTSVGPTVRAWFSCAESLSQPLTSRRSVTSPKCFASASSARALSQSLNL
jgi:hypothetical protein